ncbi:MAG: hypothetical protein WCO69_03530 [Candidatus Omnitrophota bacterium]
MATNKPFTAILIAATLLLGAGTLGNTVSFLRDRAIIEEGGPLPSSKDLIAGFTAHGLNLHPASYWKAL